MSSTPPTQSDRFARFAVRVVQDALSEATAAYWLRRAKAFAAVGSEECDEIAQACRNRAQVELWPNVETTP